MQQNTDELQLVLITIEAHQSYTQINDEDLFDESIYKKQQIQQIQGLQAQQKKIQDYDIIQHQKPGRLVTNVFNVPPELSIKKIQYHLYIADQQYGITQFATRIADNKNSNQDINKQTNVIKNVRLQLYKKHQYKFAIFQHKLEDLHKFFNYYSKKQLYDTSIFPFDIRVNYNSGDNTILKSLMKPFYQQLCDYSAQLLGQKQEILVVLTHDINREDFMLNPFRNFASQLHQLLTYIIKCDNICTNLCKNNEYCKDIRLFKNREEALKITKEYHQNAKYPGKAIIDQSSTQQFINIIWELYSTEDENKQKILYTKEYIFYVVKYMILYIGLMYNKIYNFKEYKTTKQNNINSNNPGFADINFITLKFEDINKNDLLTQMKSIVKNTYFYFGGCQGVNIDFYKYQLFLKLFYKELYIIRKNFNILKLEYENNDNKNPKKLINIDDKLLEEVIQDALKNQNLEYVQKSIENNNFKHIDFFQHDSSILDFSSSYYYYIIQMNDKLNKWCPFGTYGTYNKNEYINYHLQDADCSFFDFQCDNDDQVSSILYCLLIRHSNGIFGQQQMFLNDVINCNNSFKDSLLWKYKNLEQILKQMKMIKKLDDKYYDNDFKQYYYTTKKDLLMGKQYGNYNEFLQIVKYDFYNDIVDIQNQITKGNYDTSYVKFLFFVVLNNMMYFIHYKKNGLIQDLSCKNFKIEVAHLLISVYTLRCRETYKRLCYKIMRIILMQYRPNKLIEDHIANMKITHEDYLQKVFVRLLHYAVIQFILTFYEKDDIKTKNQYDEKEYIQTDISYLFVNDFGLQFKHDNIIPYGQILCNDQIDFDNQTSAMQYLYEEIDGEEITYPYLGGIKPLPPPMNQY